MDYDYLKSMFIDEAKAALDASNSSGGDTSDEDNLIMRVLCECSNDSTTYIGDYAFCSCSTLTSVDFPAVTTIGSSAFQRCTNLTSVNFPAAETIGGAAFSGCTNLTSVSFPAVTMISTGAFNACKNMSIASFPNATIIYNGAFAGCSALKELYLMGSSVCSLTTNFIGGNRGVGITATSGSIYVPASLIESYKTDTNWMRVSKRFVAGD